MLGGPAMAREARHELGWPRAGRKRGGAVSGGVEGSVARVLAVGRASGGCVPAGVARCSACTQGARQWVGRQSTGKCGQGWGPW